MTLIVLFPIVIVAYIFIKPNALKQVIDSISFSVATSTDSEFPDAYIQEYTGSPIPPNQSGNIQAH